MIGGVHDVGKRATHACYAHFPGTGPPGKRCSDCNHLERVGVKKDSAVCLEAARLVKFRRKKTWPLARRIDAQALACKYFKREPGR